MSVEEVDRLFKVAFFAGMLIGGVPIAAAFFLLGEISGINFMKKLWERRHEDTY